MDLRNDVSDKISEFLLLIKAVKLNVAEPFTWASGIRSPIYCDNRVTLSYPSIRTFIRQAFARVITDEFGTVDLIAGVATGAIAHGVLVAEELGLPFVYVRTSKKDHGLENVIEGKITPGQSVVVIEDLISTGSTSLSAVRSLREQDCKVKGMVAIFTYNLAKAIRNFEKEDCILFSLTDYDKLIQKALEEDYIRDEDLKALRDWRENPEAWGK
ncbi:MAG: orotate phosphoribosyltransferase [Bacteroidales bacterium]|nr:orotate phosphoribosyltransferase [Lentimicrobiaceae bacterium]MDD5695752.1 orotate phosphoribosyltransferase [Bacteroidales bacterium]